jgi:Domain of unknown function (DUF4373)
MDWFKHDSNANLDEKLQEVLLDYGLEGYGLYWYCVELIVNKISAENITFELKHDARIIARNTGSSVQKVEEMMKRFIDLGLFEGENGTITCLKVAKRLMTSATSNPKMRLLIQNIKHNQQVMIPSQQRHDDVMQDKNRIDEIRLDENKTIVQKGNEYLNDFDLFWMAYPKKVGKEAARKSWDKIKPDLKTVLETLKWQKQSDQWFKNDGQYIPNPSTYLNQHRFLDQRSNNREAF